MRGFSSFVICYYTKSFHHYEALVSFLGPTGVVSDEQFQWHTEQLVRRESLYQMSVSRDRESCIIKTPAYSQPWSGPGGFHRKCCLLLRHTSSNKIIRLLIQSCTLCTHYLLRCDRVPGNDSKRANSLTRLELTNEVKGQIK